MFSWPTRPDTFQVTTLSSITRTGRRGKNERERVDRWLVGVCLEHTPLLSLTPVHGQCDRRRHKPDAVSQQRHSSHPNRTALGAWSNTHQPCVQCKVRILRVPPYDSDDKPEGTPACTMRLRLPLVRAVFRQSLIAAKSSHKSQNAALLFVDKCKSRACLSHAQQRFRLTNGRLQSRSPLRPSSSVCSDCSGHESTSHAANLRLHPFFAAFRHQDMLVEKAKQP